MATNIQERQASKAVLPAGPARLPYIGNLLSLRLDPLGYLQRLQRTYGNMATIYFGKNPAVILFRPEYVRYVLVEHPRDFSNRGVLRNDNDDGFASEGLLTIDGEKHRWSAILRLQNHHRYRSSARHDWKNHVDAPPAHSGRVLVGTIERRDSCRNKSLPYFHTCVEAVAGSRVGQVSMRAGCQCRVIYLGLVEALPYLLVVLVYSLP